MPNNGRKLCHEGMAYKNSEPKIEPSESSFQKCVMCRATKAQNGKRQSFYSLSLELHTTCVSREHGKRNINRRLHGMTRVWYKQAPLLDWSYTVPTT